MGDRSPPGLSGRVTDIAAPACPVAGPLKQQVCAEGKLGEKIVGA